MIKESAVSVTVSPASFGPAVQVLQLYPQHCGLDGIKPEVATEDLVVVFRAVAVVAKQPGPVGQLQVIGGDHAAVAKSSQVLRWEEAETAHVADGPRSLASILGPNGLRGVFNDHQLVVDRNNGPGFVCDGSFDTGGVYVVGPGVNVNEDRPGSQPGYRSGCGEKGIGRGDHFIAGL